MACAQAMGAFTIQGEPLSLGDGSSQGFQLGQPAATLGSWLMPPPCFSSASSLQRLVPPQALSCSCSSMSAGRVCSSWTVVSRCAVTHPWDRDLLPAAGVGRAVSKPNGLLCV